MQSERSGERLDRSKEELQNKLFPIVYERCVQGMPLERLVHRWAAMNPVPDENEIAEYRGSEALDIALADRFAFIVEMPNWSSFSERERTTPSINPIKTRFKAVLAIHNVQQR